MELGLERTSLDVYTVGRELSLGREETVETIVPDYCPDLARIIETSGAVFLHDRSVREGRASVSGTVRVNVLYTPDGEGSVRALGFSVPFSVEGEADGDALLAEAELTHLETRMVNPRKLSTQCKIAVRATPYRRGPLELTCGVSADDGAPQVETRVERREAVFLTQVVQRDFSAMDEMEIPPGRPGAMELLAARAVPAVAAVETTGGRVVVKGSFTLSALYLTEDGGQGSVSAERPFSQILDLDASAADGASSSVQIQVSGMDLQIGGGGMDGHLIEAGLYLHASVLVRETREVEILSDLYSTAAEVRCETEPVPLTVSCEGLVRRQDVRELLEIGVVADRILSLSAVCGPVSVSGEENGTALRTSVAVRALYLDEGGVPLVTERRIETGCLIEVPEGRTVTARASCPDPVQGSLGERGIEVRFPVDFHVETVLTVRALCVRSAVSGPIPHGDGEAAPSLVLRRMGADEGAWDLAKRCGSTIRDILAANQLPEGSELPRGALLLIPRRRTWTGGPGRRAEEREGTRAPL